MFDDESSDSKPADRRGRKRTGSLALGVVLVVVYIAVRPWIVDSNPCTSGTPYDRGIALDLYGDKTAAIAAYTDDLKRNPQHVEALKYRARDYAELGQLDSAAADLTLALQLAPNDYDVPIDRGNVYLKLGQFDRAMADLTRAVQVGPESWSTWHARGNAYIAHGDLDAAIADYTRSLTAKYPAPAQIALYPRGVAYLRAGRFDLAKADFVQLADDAYALKGRDCADRASNTGECAIPYPKPPNPGAEDLINAAGRSLSSCKQT